VTESLEQAFLNSGRPVFFAPSFSFWLNSVLTQHPPRTSGLLAMTGDCSRSLEDPLGHPPPPPDASCEVIHSVSSPALHDGRSPLQMDGHLGDESDISTSVCNACRSAGLNGRNIRHLSSRQQISPIAPVCPSGTVLASRSSIVTLSPNLFSRMQQRVGPRPGSETRRHNRP
jgi:hypothetical protein